MTCLARQKRICDYTVQIVHQDTEHKVTEDEGFFV